MKIINKLIASIVFFLMAISLHAQIGQYYFPSVSTDEFKRIIEGSTNLIGFGNYMNGGSEIDDLLFLKLKSDSIDKTPTKFTLGGISASPGRRFDNTEDAIKTKDGGFAVVGSTNNRTKGGIINSNILIVKLKADLTIDLIKELGDSGNMVSMTKSPIHEKGKAIFQTADDGYVIAASIYDSVSMKQDIMVIKVDGSFNPVWTSFLGIGKESENLDIIEEKNSGDLIVIGQTGNADIDIFIYRVKSTGSNGLNYYVPHTGYDAISKIISTSDGGFCIVGSGNLGGTNKQVIVLKLNLLGNILGLQWLYRYDTGGDGIGTSILQNTDNSYSISGFSKKSIAGSVYRPFLIKIDNAGKYLGGKVYGPTTADSRVFDLIKTSMSSYIISGYTKKDGNNDPFLIATDFNGSTGFNCKTNGLQDTILPAFIASSYSTSLTNMNKTSTNALNINSNWNYKSFNPTIFANAICKDDLLKVYAGNDTTVCIGSKVRLGGKPTIKGGVPPYIISWTPSADIDSITKANPTLTTKSKTPYNILLTVRDALGLTATDQIRVTVRYDTSTFTGLDTSYCTSSMLDILTPQVSGAKITGCGIHYNGVVWYFKAEEAGPGLHPIICADTSKCIADTQYAKVNPAPCIDDAVADTSAGSIKVPQGIFTDCDGQIYVTNTTNIVLIDSFGISTRIAGNANQSGFKDDKVDSARMNLPCGIILTESNVLYFVDNANHCIRMRRNDSIITIAGGKPTSASPGFLDAIGTNARFDAPYGLCYDKIRNCLYVSEQNNLRIRKINLLNFQVSTIAGGGATDISSSNPIPSLNAKLYKPAHIAINGDDLYIADKDVSCIYKLNVINSTISRYAGVFKTSGSDEDKFRLSNKISRPMGVSVNCNGALYITDESNYACLAVNRDTISKYNDTTFLINEPQGISVYVKGFLDIANKGNNNILRLTIKDWKVGPWNGLKPGLVYCLGDGPDTLRPIYNCGIYKGQGIESANGKYLFRPGAAGNYKITYTFNVGNCDDSLSVIVRVATPKQVSITGTLAICSGSAAALDAGKFSKYNWNTSATTRVINPLIQGLYTVTVTDSNNCVTTDTATVKTFPKPTLTVTPLPTTVCQGSTSQLTATPTGGTTPYTYNWTPIGVPAIYNPVVTPVGPSTNYSVTVTDINTCSATANVVVNVSALPIPIITITENSGNVNNDGILCAGANVTLTATGGTSYLWSGGITNAIAFTPTSTTTYTVTVTNAASCTQTALRLITINTAPSASISYSDNSGIANNDGIVCSGASVNLTAIGGGTYSWSSGEATASITKNTTGIFTVTVTDLSNCTATDSKGITVNTLPSATITTIESSGKFNNDGIICADTNAILSASGGTSYIWSSSDTTANITKNSGTYTVTITDINNCTASGSATITVNSLPSVYVSFTDTTICDGDSVQLLATSATATSYLWTPSTRIKPITSDKPFASPINTTTYKVIASDVNNCKDDTTVKITVTSGALLTITFTPDTLICNNDSVQLTAFAPGAGITYNWSPAGSLTNPTNATTWAKPLISTSYYVTATIPLVSCPAIEQITIHVSNGLTAIAGNDTMICENNSKIIGKIPSGGLSPYTYAWTNSGGTLNNTTIYNPLATPVSVPISYTLTVTDAAGCTDTDIITLDWFPSLNITIPPIDTTCSGTAKTINSTITGVGPLNFLWSPTTDLNSTTIEDPIATINNLGNTILNRTYSVVVTDANKCTNSGFMVLTVLPLPGTNFVKDSVCKGLTKQIQAWGGTSYSWSPTTGLSSTTIANPIASDTITRIYTVIIKNNYCQPDTLSSTLKVNPYPKAIALPTDTSLFRGEEIQLNATGGVRYLWTPKDGIIESDTTATTKAKPLTTIDYIVAVSNVFGCTSYDTVKITISKKFDLYVPTAFAPNGKKLENQKHCVRGVGVAKYNIKIYNRWGQLVFESNDINNCWDGAYKGQQQQLQTFGYVLEVEDYDGNKETRKGTVTIIK